MCRKIATSISTFDKPKQSKINCTYNFKYEYQKLLLSIRLKTFRVSMITYPVPLSQTITFLPSLSVILIFDDSLLVPDFYPYQGNCISRKSISVFKSKKLVQIKR